MNINVLTTWRAGIRKAKVANGHSCQYVFIPHSQTQYRTQQCGHIIIASMVLFNTLPIFQLFGGYMYIATDVCTIFSRIKNTVSMFFFHNYILLKSQGLKTGAGEPGSTSTYKGSPFL